MINLGEEQLEAIENLKEFLNNSSLCISLVGSAGSGKTTCMKYFIEYLKKKNKNYSLVATTNKAALVLSKITEETVWTLHKLLSLTPNIEILELDFNYLQFLTKGSNEIPNNGLIICDEASMIPDELFDILIEKCKTKKCKIIFLADSAQLKPVKHNKLSKVFRIKSIILSKIYRQTNENKLTPVLVELREKCIDNFINDSGKEGSIIVDNLEKNFISKSIPLFKNSINNKDILFCKLLCYTNKHVEKYNKLIRKELFKNDSEYNQFEIITAYENNVSNKKENLNILNSMDYIILNEPKIITKKIPYFVDLPGYDLVLYDSYEKVSYNIFILSKKIDKKYFQSLAAIIEESRQKALEAPKFSSTASLNWKKYFSIINSFNSPIDLEFNGRLIKKKSFDYGYTSTVHKSQGSTYNNVFVDIQNINLCQDLMEKRQLQYVALSRTSNDAYILQ